MITNAEISYSRPNIVINHDAEKQVYEGELSRLRRENLSVKDQLQRSLRELKAYQLQFPSAYANFESNDNGENLPTWVSTPELMTPLLEAYDSRIKELEDIVSQQSNQLDHFQQKMEKILEENDDLKQLNVDNIAHRNKQENQDNFGGQSTSSHMHNEFVSELNERIDILMTENAIMVEQKAALSVEFEEVHQMLEDRTNVVSDLSGQLAGMKESVHSLQGQLESSKSERDQALLKTLSCSEELGLIQNEFEDCKTQLLMWQKKCHESEAQGKHITAQLSTTIHKNDESTAKFVERTKMAEGRVTELHGKLLSVTNQLHESHEMYRKLRREYQSTRQDAEGMLQVMNGLEKQLVEYSSREAEVEFSNRQCKDMAEDALSQRDQALARCQQNSKEIDRLIEERKKMVQSRASEIEEAVEKMRQRTVSQINAVELEMKDMSEKNAQLRVLGEKATRECRIAKEQVSKLQGQQEEERKTVELNRKDIEDRYILVCQEKQEEIHRKVLVQNTNAELRETIDKLRAQAETLNDTIHHAEKAKEVDIRSYLSTIRDLNKDLTSKSRALAKAIQQIDDLRVQTETHQRIQEKQRHDDSVGHKRRTVELERLVQELQQLKSEDSKQSAAYVEQLKNKTATTVSYLEHKLTEEKNVSQRIAQQQRVLADSIVEVSHEKEQLLESLQDAQRNLVILQQEVDETQQGGNDLAYLQMTADSMGTRVNTLIGGVYGGDMDFTKLNTFEEGREDDISADELNISFGTHATNSPLSASVSPSISAKQLSNRAASLAKSERAFEDDLREERE